MPSGHADRLVAAEPPGSRLGGDLGIVVTVVSGAMLVPLNSTMIAVALPHLIGDFHTSLRSAGWVVTGYLIAMASLQPVAGSLGDRSAGGRRCSQGSPGSAPARSVPRSRRTCRC